MQASNLFSHSLKSSSVKSSIRSLAHSDTVFSTSPTSPEINPFLSSTCFINTTPFPKSSFTSTTFFLFHLFATGILSAFFGFNFPLTRLSLSSTHFSPSTNLTIVTQYPLCQNGKYLFLANQLRNTIAFTPISISTNGNFRYIPNSTSFFTILYPLNSSNTFFI